MLRTGRPREFDRERAMDAVMHLFWSQKYEPTSLNRIKNSMSGISPAGFYAAFGSQERLFREVVKRHMRTYGRVVAVLWDEASASRYALERFGAHANRMQPPAGCLIALAPRTCSPENYHIDAMLAAESARSREGTKAFVDHGIAQKELDTSTDGEALATAFDAFLVEMASQTRDGAMQERLDAAITALLQLWDINRVQLNDLGRSAS
ncbi:TetR/AcrR family transcriptional regulator [Paraburkholderia sp. J41]|uniref:TetR/AcrR family transcriptional regulator n=1 Tax=Paraburkholderia sp. J41 TaxID=2805433 RepID=UPI002AC3724E|nr:TetR/AcrR family transcriptional regulator [Paraburkholderia sp. J41]